jgi:hypothetical protein
MIERHQLLQDLQSLLERLEADLLERSESAEVPAVGDRLRAEYNGAKQAERISQNFEDWRSDAITQNAAAWVLSCVFVRFLEDNRLVEPPRLAGPDDRLQRARDEHELYFRSHPTQTDREYLLAVFDDLARLPGGKEIFGPHNTVCELPNWLSGDAAGELLKFFQKIDADTGLLVHDFTDANWDTRFLGDLYQDLSEAARKKYALLQTPEFVEEFILDRALDPALDEFGLDAPPVKDRDGKPVTEPGFRMIDPACGSGHFLLGSFRRILDRWQRKEPGTLVRELVRKTLESINGVDLNPYAVAIARFRLLLAAMRACGITRLADAPAFHINVACGDSLLHGSRRQMVLGDWTPLAHYFHSEISGELERLLVRRRYHVVVANPPYITPKDRALNQAYRDRYSTCHMKYSLAVPFMERIFQLATDGGYTGQITANSFMKREFGKKLIEEFFPKVDLTHVIDTSGAYIPGHGTPTVILFARNRKPVASTIRTVMGIRGEPSTPEDPASGVVWSAIVGQIDQPGSQSEFVSVAESPRDLFHKHPWSIGGGGAAELKEQLDELRTGTLGELTDAIGITAVTGEDELFLQSATMLRRHGIEHRCTLVEGDTVRDWRIESPTSAVWLYDGELRLYRLEDLPNTCRLFWSYRASIYWRKRFGTPLVKRGLTWYEWQELYKDKLRTPLSIVFAFVATHNHFVLDRGGKVFKQSAPVIKLPPSATEDDHFALLGLLNSSAACFWMKQVFHNKGSTVDQHGARQTTIPFENFWEHDGTKLNQFPLPKDYPTEVAKRIEDLAQQQISLSPWASFSGKAIVPQSSLGGQVCSQQAKSEHVRHQMIAHQEELDWQCYRLYGLLRDDLTYARDAPAIQLGQRAFEIVLARKMAAGELQTTWFERHGSTPITEIPTEWPEDYRRLVCRRIEKIQTDRNIALIEQPEYKRRWNTEPWDSQLERALRNWLLDRMEAYFDFDGRMNEDGKPTGQLDQTLISVGKLADIAQQDTEFLQVGELYRDHPGFDVQKLVTELVEAESVPLLPVLRYKPSGLRRRTEWERTWELQRQEDSIDARTRLSKDHPDFLTEDQAREVKRREVGDIPVPPKYVSADFLTSGFWRLRGKLDVPKERWVSFPYCEGNDGMPMIAWAGYNHLQLTRAISTYYVDVQERLGGRDDPRLVPLMACLIELLPWLKQWHNEFDREFGMPLGDYFEGFIQEEARQMGKTLAEIQTWQPPQRTRRDGRRSLK